MSDIIKFKLNYYDTNTHQEKPFTRTVLVRAYSTYEFENEPVRLGANIFDPDSSGYYTITDVGSLTADADLLLHVYYSIEPRESEYRELYSPIYLYPYGFIEFTVKNRHTTPYTITTTGLNRLQYQDLCFYPTAKRLTKAELRKAIVSTPHYLKDGGMPDSYCPTQALYNGENAYFMQQAGIHYDNDGYVCGAMNVGPYLHTMLYVSSPNNDILYDNYGPGAAKQLNSRSDGITHPYKSAEVKITAEAYDSNKFIEDDDSQNILNGVKSPFNIMENTGINFTVADKTFTYGLGKMELELTWCSENGNVNEDRDANVAIAGFWMGDTPSWADNVAIKFVLTDGYGYASINCSPLPQGKARFTLRNAVMYNSYADGDETETLYGLNYNHVDNLRIAKYYMSRRGFYPQYNVQGNYYNIKSTVIATGNTEEWSCGSSGGGSNPVPPTTQGGIYTVGFFANSSEGISIKVTYDNSSTDTIWCPPGKMVTVQANEISWTSSGSYTIQDSNENVLANDEADTGVIPTGNSSIDGIYTLNVVFS